MRLRVVAGNAGSLRALHAFRQVHLRDRTAYRFGRPLPLRGTLGKSVGGIDTKDA
ncbi:MAG: phage DNA packaging protein J [Chitinispirillales bacterium]|nr:phage DNA packaging protein J [Chitinispirillales bacterium]